jgi:predicted outer membrane repeat protein
LEGSAAEDYGCQTFLDENNVNLSTDLFSSHFNDAPNLSSSVHKLNGDIAEVGGVISEDTTWNADIIRVIDTVEVLNNATLTISPGTTIEFDGFFRLIVHGRLWAVGEPGNRINFTTSNNKSVDCWDGIDFHNIPAANEPSRLEHCNISNAVAVANKDGSFRTQTGGAISIVGVNNLTIASCIFENNRAEFGGAIYIGFGSSPVLAGNLFYHNTAEWNGSAIFSVSAYPKLINNTISENFCLAGDEYYSCGAVENFNGKIVLTNNIIRNNYSNFNAGLQLVGEKDYYILANNLEAYIGNSSNVDIDPGFWGQGAYPFQLVENASSIDAGINSAYDGVLSSYDISGNDRVCGSGIDMGCHEFCGSLNSVSFDIIQPTVTCSPNPFNPRTQIVFELPQDSQVSLEVFDLKGHLLQTLINERMASGRHEANWNGVDHANQDQASGIYLFRLKADGVEVKRTVTLLR